MPDLASSKIDNVSESVKTPKWPRKPPFRPTILVMKGGGVKGIAYVGALEVLNEYGYQFDHFVGTSAGAISAALLAVGYNPKELGEILAKTDFSEFKDGWLFTSLLLLPFRKGLYQGEAFRMWLEKNLREKFPQYSDTIPIRFKHLKNAEDGPKRLTVFVSIKSRKAFAFDSSEPANSDDEISFACRCSMAIPYFFRPEKIGGQYAVDGGMQNNYPVYAILDNYPDLKESSNFIGLYLGHKEVKKNSAWLFLDLFSIWGESGDEEAKEYFIDRTIVIDPRPVKTTDFSLSQSDVEFLLAEGKASALRWLHHWSDGKRPTEEEVEKAEAQVTQLREQIIKERWKKFWPNLLPLILLLLTCILYFTRPDVINKFIASISITPHASSSLSVGSKDVLESDDYLVLHSVLDVDLTGWMSVETKSAMEKQSPATITRRDLIRKNKETQIDYQYQFWTSGLGIDPESLLAFPQPEFSHINTENRPDGGVRKLYRLRLPLANQPVGVQLPMFTQFTFWNSFQKTEMEDWRARIQYPTQAASITIRFPASKKVTSVVVFLADENGAKISGQQALSENNPVLLQNNRIGSQIALWAGLDIPGKRVILFEWKWSDR